MCLSSDWDAPPDRSLTGIGCKMLLRESYLSGIATEPKLIFCFRSGII